MLVLPTENNEGRFLIESDFSVGSNAQGGENHSLDKLKGGEDFENSSENLTGFSS